MTRKARNNSSREKIMAHLREAAGHEWENNWPGAVPVGDVFPPDEDLLESFREELSALGGEVFIEQGEERLFERLKELGEKREWKELTVSDEVLKSKLESHGISIRTFDPGSYDFEAGVTGCDALVALTGSVMVSSGGSTGRRMNVFPPVHIVIARESQLVASIKEGFIKIEADHGSRPSQITLISGPSRTADIEKTLVMGAHGPRELFVLVDVGNVLKKQ